jgi:hypothetical protein
MFLSNSFFVMYKILKIEKRILNKNIHSVSHFKTFKAILSYTKIKICFIFTLLFKKNLSLKL